MNTTATIINNTIGYVKFQILIKNISESASKQEENRIICKEANVIRDDLKKLGSESGYYNRDIQARDLLTRVLYCCNYGYEFPEATIAATVLIKSANAWSRQVAFLVLSKLLNEDHKVLNIITNTILQDISTLNIARANPALTFCTKIIGVDVVDSVCPLLMSVLTRNSLLLKRKALIALKKVIHLAGVELFDDYQFIISVIAKDNLYVFPSLVELLLTMYKAFNNPKDLMNEINCTAVFSTYQGLNVNSKSLANKEITDVVHRERLMGFFSKATEKIKTCFKHALDVCSMKQSEHDKLCLSRTISACIQYFDTVHELDSFETYSRSILTVCENTTFFSLKFCLLRLLYRNSANPDIHKKTIRELNLFFQSDNLDLWYSALLLLGDLLKRDASHVNVFKANLIAALSSKSTIIQNLASNLLVKIANSDNFVAISKKLLKDELVQDFSDRINSAFSLHKKFCSDYGEFIDYCIFLLTNYVQRISIALCLRIETVFHDDFKQFSEEQRQVYTNKLHMAAARCFVDVWAKYKYNQQSLIRSQALNVVLTIIKLSISFAYKNNDEFEEALYDFCNLFIALDSIYSATLRNVNDIEASFFEVLQLQTALICDISKWQVAYKVSKNYEELLLATNNRLARFLLYCCKHGVDNTASSGDVITDKIVLSLENSSPGSTLQNDFCESFPNIHTERELHITSASRRYSNDELSRTKSDNKRVTELLDETTNDDEFIVSKDTRWTAKGLNIKQPEHLSSQENSPVKSFNSSPLQVAQKSEDTLIEQQEQQEPDKDIDQLFVGIS